MNEKGKTAVRQMHAPAAQRVVGASAMVRLSGVAGIAPEAFLQLADGVRRAVRLAGITEVTIEVDVEEPDA